MPPARAEEGCVGPMAAQEYLGEFSLWREFRPILSCSTGLPSRSYRLEDARSRHKQAACIGQGIGAAGV